MRCARCGKEFHVGADGWGYDYDGKLTCSYSCMRAMEKEDGKMGENAKRIITDEDRQKIDEMAAQGFDNSAIAEAMGLTRSAVGGYIGRKKREAAQFAAPRETPEAPEAAWSAVMKRLEKDEARDADELTLAVVTLMADMMELLKRIL